MSEDRHSSDAGAADPFAGGGDMGALMRATDWSATPLGPQERWSPSLQAALSICLNSAYPIALYWGPSLALLYNDAWSPILGNKHPWALGRPGREVWPEIWDNIGPLFDRVRIQGEGVWQQDEFLPMRRHGYTEECYFNFTFSPIRGQGGLVEGVFNAVVETTYRVIGERRSKLLRELAQHTAGAASAEQACSLAAETLAGASADVTFALLYLLEEGSDTARLACTSGLDPGLASSPVAPLLSAANALGLGWPLARAAMTGQAQRVENLVERFGELPGGPWNEAPHTALVLPMARPGQETPFGLLVVGVSPRRELDEEYQGFMAMIAAQIATAVGNARAYEVERKRAEALAELDKAKTAFFSNVSHEFRTPLTLMLGPLEDLLNGEKGPLPEAQRAEIEVTHRNSLRLLRLVNTLLDFSRIEAGRADALYEPTDLAAYSADLASTFRSAIEKAGLRLLVHTPPLPELVYVDRAMWEKIVLNLLSNAFKFTLEGEISLTMAPTPNGVQLEVSDTGTGIPPEDLHRIFDRFHRVESAVGRSHEGTGIGLALVQELTGLHGGTVSVESTVGAGSTFRVVIPTGTAHLPADRLGSASDPFQQPLLSSSYVEELTQSLVEDTRASAGSSGASALAALGPDASTTPATGPRILLADDNGDMRAYITRLLTQQHYRVEAVPNGAAALEIARRERPDLIISDVMMPQMDGFELLGALRADPGLSDLPVLLLSARAGEESRVEGLEAGADDYLVKPFSSRELLARVGARLELSRVRREVGGALSESEERFRNMADNTPVMLWVTDPSGYCTYLNQRWYEFTGETPQKSLGFGWIESAHPDDQDVARDAFINANAQREPYRVEFRLRRADGEYRWAIDAAAPRFNPDGEFLGYIGSVIDIQERKAMEQERERLLAEAEDARTAAELAGARLHEIFMRAPAYIATFRGPDHIFETANPSYLRIIGRDSRILGQPAAEVLSGVADESVLEMLDTVYRTGHPFIGKEASVFTESGLGPELFVNFIYTPLLDSDGSISGIFLHAVDVTEQVRARREVEHAREATQKLQAETEAINEELKRTNEELADRTVEAESAREEAEEANRSKALFLATMSHELRTPLNAIIGYSDLLDAEIAGTLTTGQKGQLERIDLAARHLLQIIEEILTFSRIEAGREEVQIESVDLSQIVRDTAALVEPLATVKQLRFEVDIPPRLQGEADSGKVRQILLNLLSNAVKFTDEGGVRLALEERDDQFVLRVSDTGIGIAIEHQGRIFEPFSQIEQAPSRRVGGTGLGLTVTAHLARLMGGSISIDSSAGNGSTFVVVLPLHQALGIASVPIA